MDPMWLGIDTAGEICSVALADARHLYAEYTWRSLRRHTREVAPRIRQLLADQGITAAELGGIALTIGPGSYTGLRTGLAVAKGLALGARLQVVGVPTLDVAAAPYSPPFVPRETRLWGVMDVGKGRIAAAAYPAQVEIHEANRDAAPTLAANLDAALTLAANLDASPTLVAQPEFGAVPALAAWAEHGGATAFATWPAIGSAPLRTVAELLADATPGEWVVGEMADSLRAELAAAGLHVLAPPAGVRRAAWLVALALADGATEGARYAMARAGDWAALAALVPLYLNAVV